MAFRLTYQTPNLALDSSVNEQTEEVKAVWAQRDNVAPSGVSVCGAIRVTSSSDPCYFRYWIYRFDGTSGEYIGRTMPSAWNAVDSILIRRISWHDGVLVYWRDLSTRTLDPDTHEAIMTSGTLFPTSFTYWGGTDAVQEHFGWDRNRDIWFQNSSSLANGEVAVYRASTGADLGIRIFATGNLDPAGYQGADVMVTRPPYGYAISVGGFVAFFNYDTGQIHNVSRMPGWDSTAGESKTERVYGYDSFNDRLLVLDQPTDVGGDFPGVIKGYNPTPQAVRLQQPVAIREPRVNNDATRIFTRAIGSSGEAIGGLPVTFSDQGVGDVAPVTVVTDRYGYAEALYDGLTTGGAETITVTAETPADIFPPSDGQGSGGSISQWSPEVHLDFRAQTQGADVSALLTEQVDWDKGTAGYGVDANTGVKRIYRTSSARLRIQSGTAGTPSTAANGSFGGNLALTGTQQIGQGEQLWVGAWVYMNLSFDYTTTSDGLLLFRIGNDQTANFISIRLKDSATNHVGWALEWPDETVTDTRHNFTADSSVLLVDQTWHFVQYYIQPTNNGGTTIQRLWLDNLLVWELNGTAAQYRDSGGGGSLTSFTANESIAGLTLSSAKLDELRVFNNWEGNAPSDQTCYVGNVVWSRDDLGLLPTDANGYRYISPVTANAL